MISFKAKNRTIRPFTCKDKALLILFILIISYFSICLSHALTYDINNNCCRHMTERIENVLESVGIDVQVIRGDSVDSTKNGHVWFNVWGIHFDSVNLFPYWNVDHYTNITEFNDYEDYLESRKL